MDFTLIYTPKPCWGMATQRAETRQIWDWGESPLHASGGLFGGSDLFEDGLVDFSEHVVEVNFGDVEGFDSEVGDDSGLELLEFLLLGFGDGHSGLFLAGEVHEFFFEVGEHSPGFGVGGDGFLGVLVLLDGGVNSDEVAEFVREVHDFGGVGHRFGSIAIAARRETAG